MAGLTLLETDAVDIPTPSAGKATIFLPTADVPSYKDDAGVVLPLGTTGAAGADGATGPQGPGPQNWFPAGWNDTSVLPTGPTIRATTGTSEAISEDDDGNIITCNNGSPVSLTVPAGLPSTFTCVVAQLGAGQVTFTPSSTTLHGFGGALKLAGQYAAATIIATASDVFLISGNISV